jgi:tetratricopeptide (TPR) repeat protein
VILRQKAFMPLRADLYPTFLFILAVFLVFPVETNAVTITKEQMFQVATLAARDGEYEKAINFFKKVTEMDPHFAPAYNSIGLVYQAMGAEDSPSESQRYFKLAVDVDPSYVESWTNLGKAYYSSGQFVQAENALLKSLELRPDQADIELVLGWVYLIGESRAESSIKYFEMGLAQVDDDMAHYGLGLANILLGDKFKVLDQITELRHRNKEELAVRLETMVRNNVKISSRPGTPLITGADQGSSVFDKELQDLTSRGFNAGSDGKIQVRLKGPLAN